MRNIMLGLIFLLTIVNVQAICIEPTCNVVRDDEIIAPNIDINLLQSTEHNSEGLSFDFDVNITIRKPNGTYVVQNTPASQSQETGVWYYQLIGGLSDKGDHIIIWNAEHKAGGVPDGNKDSEIWKLKVQVPDLNNSDFNKFISQQLTDTNTSLTNEINDIGSSTLFEDDLNAYIDSARTVLATNVQEGQTLYLRGRGDNTTLPQAYSTVSEIWFVETDTNNLVETEVKWLLVRENGDLLSEIVVPDVNNSKTHRVLLSAKDNYGGLAPNVFSGEYKTSMTITAPPKGDTYGGLSEESKADFESGNIPGLIKPKQGETESVVESEVGGIPNIAIVSLFGLVVLGLFFRSGG